MGRDDLTYERIYTTFIGDIICSHGLQMKIKSETCLKSTFSEIFGKKGDRSIILHVRWVKWSFLKQRNDVGKYPNTEWSIDYVQDGRSNCRWDRLEKGG